MSFTSSFLSPKLLLLFANDAITSLYDFSFSMISMTSSSIFSRATTELFSETQISCLFSQVFPPQILTIFYRSHSRFPLVLHVENRNTTTNTTTSAAATTILHLSSNESSKPRVFFAFSIDFSLKIAEIEEGQFSSFRRHATVHLSCC